MGNSSTGVRKGIHSPSRLFRPGGLPGGPVKSGAPWGEGGKNGGEKVSFLAARLFPKLRVVNFYENHFY
jgi:hypothetical protein